MVYVCLFPNQPPLHSLSTVGCKKVKTSTASEGGVVEQPTLDMDAKLMNLEAKVDKLVDVVAKMGDKVQTHASATPLSPVPAAHGPLWVEKEGNKQLPTFEELKSDPSRSCKETSPVQPLVTNRTRL